MLALCPTRWCVRARALQRVLDLWPSIRRAVNQLLKENCRRETKIKLESLKKSMAKAKTYLSILISKTIFVHCEDLAKELQSAKITATGAIRSAELLISVLCRLRSDQQFESLYHSCETITSSLHLTTISENVHHRNAAPPSRYEDKSKPSTPHKFSARDKIKQEYFMCLDILISEIKRRFDQAGLRRLVALETLLLNACSSVASEVDDVQEATRIYSDIGGEKLSRELRMLPDLMQNTSIGGKDSKQFTAKELATVLTDNVTIRGLFSETLKVVSVLLVVPASAANAERSFSMLRRLKTWLRCTMSQARLTHLAILHCHQDRLQRIVIDSICHEFVMKTPERMAVFGIY